MSNIVAIVGRPNVGKSTFFNRMVGGRDAIVDEVSGVTRDRHYGVGEWNGKRFTLIDTGGYVVGSDDVFEEEIRKQVTAAIEEADLIIFVVDVETGITDMDKTVANMLRQSERKVLLAVNKVDNSMRVNDATEFYALGLGEYHCVSAINGSGTGELLDEMASELSDEDPDSNSELPRFAIVGRPNVGKSSLVNALLGEDRHIVTPVAGTTRDAIHSRYNKFGFDFMLVDTAGLRKKGKVHEDLEFYSVMRTVRAIENCDVCFLLLDAQEEFGAQDMNIFRLAQRNKKGIVILVNKWDLVQKDTHTALQYEKLIKEKIQPFTDVPILFISALTKQRIMDAMKMGVQVYENRRKKIATSVLNEWIEPVLEKYPPPAVRGLYVKIKYVTQLPIFTPTFAFFCNHPQHVKDPYKRFLENRLRESFDFTGVPINIVFRKK
ncbi:MAG: ribosome biogenesis GTPase Der [Flavobacteriales bacterium]|nr:ribosome biogenesis GTPase Der [Flavobacteriales bacterium]MCB9448395.1 ribosome biogenesis GTPase Der [Flavobacteriales bacterium]